MSPPDRNATPPSPPAGTRSRSPFTSRRCALALVLDLAFMGGAPAIGATEAGGDSVRCPARAHYCPASRPCPVTTADARRARKNEADQAEEV